MEMEDYEEEPLEDDVNNSNCHLLRLLKQYFMESCKLAQLDMWKTSWILLVTILRTKET